ncbi:hypothetical protein RA2_04076 [Roseovarius sp. A-2]|uniref:hypothetical protein n=1 Tax=Roseovarius sp. A-2 TaxID=1570360 RepID=UPI0009B5569A|nr:hypothetical protein [Roseovarius sp. A-2]GAW37001.1 hypothetical protein RA2_04076 [Roseovarius sp. A-2]
MADAADAVVNEVVSVAQSLGLPVEIDRPYDFDEEELPLVVVHTQDEELIDEEGMPREAWDVTWRIAPVIEVWVRADDPLTIRSTLSGHWSTLRTAIRDSNILSLVRGGSRPGLVKKKEEIEGRPGLAGFSVEIECEIERD